MLVIQDGPEVLSLRPTEQTSSNIIDPEVPSLELGPLKKKDQRRLDTHRYYEREYPEIEELVLARITRIESMGAYAELLEYGYKEAMLLLSELSKRRFRSVNKLIKVGRVEYVMVIRVDQEKGYIDLSKKRVESGDIPAVEERYSKSKKVHLIVREVSELYPEFTVTEIYQEVIWPLYQTFPHALDGLLVCLEDPERAFKHVNREKIPQQVLDSITKDLMVRMSPPMSKMRSTFDVSCTGYEGVEAVKRSISAGVKKANAMTPTDEADFICDLTVRLIAPPRFICTTSDHNRERGIERIKALMDETEKQILTHDGGSFRVFEEVHVFGAEDEVKVEEEESSDEYDDESSEEIEGMGYAEGEE